MGSYLNPDTNEFQRSLNSEIYVDKTELIAVTNKYLNTRQGFMCISRPRRFGKSTAMEMLSAYYSAGTDSHTLFDGLKISSDPSYNRYINKYNVIRINMQEFLSRTATTEELIAKLTKYLLRDLLKTYKEIDYFDREDLFEVLKNIYEESGVQFVILIDEWDCLLREKKSNEQAQKQYLDFLRSWMKDQSYVALAYMTGILPIKKYGTHSVLNMFREYSMTNPRELAPYFGFTEEEVRVLCEQYRRSFDAMRSWYDGYELAVSADGLEGENIHTVSLYNPRSVVESVTSGIFDTYWNQTETYEALKVYIQMNMDGLKDAVVRMLAGEKVEINTGTFVNDMVTFAKRDDVLTLLVHLGYLSYDRETKTVRIPNKEVSQEYVNTISTMSWTEVTNAVDASKKLLEALWEKDGDKVAAGVDKAHSEISILEYNDENSLSCCIHLAFYYAREYYNICRELPAGKGFADVVFVPRPLHMDKPAVVIELKKDRSGSGAIAQIRNRQYCESLKDYHGNLLLCGINYDSKTKTHSCVIETLEKQM